MPVLILYIIKVSISLATVFLFYQLILRRLTFYNWNRWYLLGYTMLCYVIPFIDIDPFIHKTELSSTPIIQLIPVLNEQVPNETPSSTFFTITNILITVLAMGFLIMVSRLVIQLISFRKLVKKAELISDQELKVYQVNESIIPFSFGNAVFINRQQHSAQELEEIIRHEFVHARQKHSIDIIWGEVLCSINWFNPFAWLLKKSIRQNLEFIADNKVLLEGIDKKVYQYLLLKVIGNTQFSIAAQFNFSSLKKRIAMMNKTKSARRQLLRMLFLLPATAVLLLAFRNKFQDTKDFSQYQQIQSIDLKNDKSSQTVTDSIPEQKKPNEKGYYIDVKDKDGECLLVIKDKERKEVKRMLLTEWNEKTEYYENIYGFIPPPPEKEELDRVILISRADNRQGLAEFGITGDAIVSPSDEYTDVIVTGLPATGISTTGNGLNDVVVSGISLGKIDTLPKNLKNIESEGNKVTVTLANGNKEFYDMSLEKDKTAFEKKYGLSVVTINSKNISTASTFPSPATAATNVNGKVYTTNNANLAIVSQGSGTNINSTNSVNAKVATVANANIANSANSNVAIVSPFGQTINSANPEVVVSGVPLPGEVDIEITISKTTKPEELEAIISKLKEKGYELKFNNKNYDDGVLNNISGTIKYKDAHASFNFSGFIKFTIMSYKDGDKVRFRVFSGPKKVVT